MEVKVTVRELAAAIRANGLQKIKDSLFLYELVESDNKSLILSDEFREDAVLIGGCAIGQAYVNLGLHPTDVYTPVFDTPAGEMSVWVFVTDLNDSSEESLENIAGQLEIVFQDNLDEVCMVGERATYKVA